MNVRYRLFLFTVGLFAAFTALFYVYSYFQLDLVQVLIVPAIIAALVLFVPLIILLNRRKNYIWAGVFVLLGLAIAYVGNEIIWQGLTVYNLIGGILLLVLAGNFVLPRKYGIWFAVCLFYSALIALANVTHFLPFTRYEYTFYPIIFPFSLGANLLLSLAILAQILVEFQARSIRTRLLATFVLLVFLPVAAIGALSSLLNANNAQQRVIDQLNSVVTLKAAEIDTWTNNLEIDFRRYFPRPDQISLFETVISRPAGQAVDPAVNAILADIQAGMETTNLFDEIFFLNPGGRIVLSTQANRIGQEQGNAPYFQPALTGIYHSGLYFSPTVNKNVVVLAGPIINDRGEVIGEVAGRANLATLQTLMEERSGLGETGETYLVTNQQEMLTASSVYPNFKQGQSITSIPIRKLIEKATSPDLIVQGSGQYISYQNLPVLGYYRWLPGLELELFAEQQQAEALASTYRSLLYTVILSIVSVVFAFVVGLYAAQRISQPLGELSETAKEIAAGKSGLQASDTLIAGLDEIGTLARAFNSMTSQLHGLVGELEKRVEDRTMDLETRSHQLQLAAETARDATVLRDFDELLTRGVHLIRDRFGFDMVSVYLVDERGDTALLAARTELISSNQTGISDNQEEKAFTDLISKFDRLDLDRTVSEEENYGSVIAEVCFTGASRLAELTSDWKVAPAGSEKGLAGLEDTAATEVKMTQAVLPLRTAGKIIGAMDIQSGPTGTKYAGLLDNSLVAVLQIVADQLAIAIESARLLRQTRETLRELQLVYGNFTRSSWQNQLERKGAKLGYRFRGLQVEQMDEHSEPGKKQAEVGKVSVPLQLRGQEIGQLHFSFDQDKPNAETMAVYQEIANRLSLLLENARLLQEAQNLASREQQINQITNQVRSSINLEAILRNTVRELGATFGASRTFIQINPTFEQAGAQADELDSASNEPASAPLQPAQNDPAVKNDPKSSLPAEEREHTR